MRATLHYRQVTSEPSWCDAPRVLVAVEGPDAGRDASVWSAWIAGPATATGPDSSLRLLEEDSEHWTAFVRLAFDLMEDDLARDRDLTVPRAFEITRAELDAYINEGGIPTRRRCVDLDDPC